MGNVNKQQKDEGCIILNKPFIGGYIDQGGGNEANELINFFLDDKGNHFIYCNPYGQNVANAKEKEIEYIVFTSNTKDKSFYIEYIVKIKEVLHKKSLKPRKDNLDNIKKIRAEAIEEISKNLPAEYNKEIEKIRYGGVPITKLFGDIDHVIPVTFWAEWIYKVKEPVKIKYSEKDNIFDYNFQRNFGYVAEKTKKPKAYRLLKGKIEEIKNDESKYEKLVLEKFVLEKGTTEIKPTFMDLISMFRQEECYTQILYKLFNYKKELITDFLTYLKKEIANDQSALQVWDESFNKRWELFSEYAIEKVGRLDLYACNEDVNVIIENKIDSGINFIKRDGKNVDQLTRYYKYFEEVKLKKNIYLVIVPHEKLDFIKAEIASLNTDEEIKKAYCVVDYKQVYNFFKEKDGEFSAFEYESYIKDALELFRRLSLSRKEMCEEHLRRNIKVRHFDKQEKK